jgi:osmotically-inducible protein OsmY
VIAPGIDLPQDVAATAALEPRQSHHNRNSAMNLDLKIAPHSAVDAERLGDDITHALGHSWFFDPRTIAVTIEGTKVTLSGTVRSERERKMAAAAAWAEDGVTDVQNDLTVV